MLINAHILTIFIFWYVYTFFIFSLFYEQKTTLKSGHFKKQ